MNPKIAYVIEVLGYLAGVFGAIYLMDGELFGIILIAGAFLLVSFGHKERKVKEVKSNGK